MVTHSLAMRHPWLQRLSACPVIGIIRSPRQDWGYQMAATAIEAGIECIEIAWGDEAITLDLIQQLRHTYPQCSIGVGTLLSASQLTQAIEAGSQFGFSPVTDAALIRQARSLDFPFIPGALTPTEIFAAWQQEAIAIKVFPIKGMGGAPYLGCLQEALGSLPLIPTGGVNPDNALELLTAGAIAVGLSGSLFPRHANGEPNLLQTQRIAQRMQREISKTRIHQV
ncbi:MAG: bifunctional 4-hydroxy-2-oxoglutarate aldolase/2-dehydro-3-deoxy-phosphogluconate aldolase [Prochlorotrichaceae cyanobacterium]